ncbi:MAG: beta-galactosidase [Tetrasphaera sp.]|nr:beta-galactosidase [Tetrasphaera sp.]
MRTWPTDRVAFGGDYNPEQWPREVWDDDIALMTQAGVSFVTLGVFAWAHLEPEKGRHDFEWLDEVLERLARAEIAVDLATGTATPPPWLSRAHPEILPVDRDGHTLWPGSRQAWCPSDQLFRSHALALTTALAERYHDHPALAMWHVGNEFACHNIPCYCDTCAVGFRTWLRARHTHLDALNEAWGTSFWSQRYTHWDEILPPRRTTTFANPTQVLDYRRFQSDTLLDHYLAERDILHEVSPGVPVTTNFMTMHHFRELDYHRWAPHQDVVSTDHYVVASLEHPRHELAFSGDLTRGLAGGRPWVLMEHSTSAVNWQPVNPAKRPGQTIRDSLTHVAHGADTVGYFQWRASTAGSEKFHSALVPHAGADSERFREVARLGGVLGRLGELVGSRVEADVALIWDFEAQWAVGGPGMPSGGGLDYPLAAHTIHRLLLDRGVACDVLAPGAPLTGYAVVVVPTTYLLSDDEAALIAQAADAGADVLVTFFSGISTRDDHVRLGGYPGALRELLGVRVEEFFPLLAGESVALAPTGGGHTWSEWLTVGADTEVLAHYGDGPLAGRPAVTRRAVGAGHATYVSTLPDDEALGLLLDRVLSSAGVVGQAGASERVEVVRRVSAEKSWLFVLNHSAEPVTLNVPIGWDLVEQRQVSGELTLPPDGCAVIRERVAT